MEIFAKKLSELEEAYMNRNSAPGDMEIEYGYQNDAEDKNLDDENLLQRSSDGDQQNGEEEDITDVFVQSFRQDPIEIHTPKLSKSI